MSRDRNYVAEIELPVSIENSFAYHDRPGALDRLIPPWESVTIERNDGSLAIGSRVVLVTRILGVPVRWIAEHTRYEPPNLFADTQLSGPFASWDHTHLFRSLGNDRSVLTDSIQYRLPFGQLGDLMGSGRAEQTIESMFAYRHRLTKDDLSLTADYNLPPLSVAVSGSNGLVGRRLTGLLTLLGHQTRAIVRSKSNNDDEIAVWSDDLEYEKLDPVDAVVHLAGKSIADSRWTDSVKNEIRDSRVVKTRELCEKLARLNHKPRVLVCASATGIYGDRGNELLTESSALGDDFLADVAKQWETACQPAIDAGIRVVNARFGIILTPAGGALRKMLTPAKLAGGSLGSGHQWWSWIAIDDALGGIYHSIANQSVSGPVNFVSPQPITNRDFAKTLAKVLHRPALLPAPAFALRLALGEMADALLLASTRVEPNVLSDTGYQFRFTDLEEALRFYLGQNRLESKAQ